MNSSGHPKPVKVICDALFNDDGCFNLNKTASTECLCPKCGAVHRLKFLWTGRGMPKKYCQACKLYAASIDETICEISPVISFNMQKMT